MQGLRPGQGRYHPTLRWHLVGLGPQRQRIYVITPGTCNSHEHGTKNKEAAPSHVPTRTALLLAWQGKAKKKIIRPTILLRVGVLWAVAGWLSPRSSLEAFPQPTRQVVARARTPWELSGLGNARGPGEWNGHHLLFLRTVGTPPSLSTTGLQLKFSSAGPSWSRASLLGCLAHGWDPAWLVLPSLLLLLPSHSQFVQY